MNNSTSGSKKISQLETVQSLSLLPNKKNVWMPAAKYNDVENSYSNIAIRLDAITSYLSSYVIYTLGNVNNEAIANNQEMIREILNSYIAYITYNNTEFPISYVTSYCTTYSSYLIENSVRKITNNLTTLLEGIKNTHSNSYFRNNSKKVSELKGRETITKHQDHTWFPVAQYDSRSNSYHNIAINLGTITSYVNSYSTNLLSYHLDNIYNRMSYVEVTSMQWQYLEEGYEPTISLEDIQELQVTKKFITLCSEDYTPEAFEYIKQLCTENESILFDQSTQQIWTLGKWFGSDVFKKDLLYYNKINLINNDDELISYLNAPDFASTLNLRHSNGIGINLISENNKDIIEINLKLNEIISNDSQNDYVLYIDENNKIGVKRYEKPNITINKIDFNENIDELEYHIDSSIPIENWNEFQIMTENCQLIENDIDNKKLKIRINTNNYKNDINEIIKIIYDDGRIKDTYILNGIFNIYCYYGYYNPMLAQYITSGEFIINNENIEIPFEIDQLNIYHGFLRCPIKYNPIIIDNIRCMQGAWIYANTVDVFGKKYKTYLTENAGLGKIQWKIKNNI